MTVSRSIAQWLEGYGMKAVKIDTDQVGEGADSLGIFKSPEREVTDYNDSSYRIKEYYQLFAVRDGQEKQEREENDEWLENFAYWVDDCRYHGDFPKLDTNRKCTDIELTGTPYMFETKENNAAIYQVSLAVTYSREREEEEW